MANRYRDQCPQGHPTPTQAHRTANGQCRECHRLASRAEREQVRAVLAEARKMAATFADTASTT